MSYSDVRVTKDEKNWEAEISTQIDAASLEKYRADVLKDMQKTAKIDGFRPGKAPVDKILAIYGEDQIMRRAAERAIQEELPEILAKESIAIVETPRVSTDEPQSGKPLHFTARAGLAPQIELGDYAKIAKKQRESKEEITVTDAEHDEALLHLRRERARIDKIENGVEPPKAAEESREMKADELPELDDAFAQSVGYESASKFSEALHDNIMNEKTMQAQQKLRNAILDEIVKASTVRYPASLLSYELDEIESRLKDDLQRMRMTYEKYLIDTKKTREELREEWRPAADNRAKVRLLLAEIARKENIEPETDVVEHELDHAQEHYPQADRESLRAHVRHALRNEMTLRFLEGNTEPVGHTTHQHST